MYGFMRFSNSLYSEAWLKGEAKNGSSSRRGEAFAGCAELRSMLILAKKLVLEFESGFCVLIIGS